MDRKIFTKEHETFRQSYRKYLQKEVIPHQPEWEKEGIVPREAWLRAGELGFLCPWLDEEYGGFGADFLYSVIIAEELSRAGVSGFFTPLHSDIVAPYIYRYGTEEQKRRWLPRCVRGEIILAIAMTEPGAGSDLAALKTTAIRRGKEYVINGTKTFVSNGHLADLVVVAARTDPESKDHSAISLLLVEARAEGFHRGRRLEKMGLKSQDTAELHFDDCVVAENNILGFEGGGFYMLMAQLAQERLMVAIGAQAGAEEVLRATIEYTKERMAFGRSISRFQNTRFRFAEMATEIELGRVFLDRVIQDHMEGKELVKEASMAKWWVTEMLKRTVDQCLQFFGGYGYMMEYPIAKAFLDARVQTIYAGTTEIMKEIIARQMDL